MCKFYLEMSWFSTTTKYVHPPVRELVVPGNVRMQHETRTVPVPWKLNVPVPYTVLGPSHELILASVCHPSIVAAYSVGNCPLRTNPSPCASASASTLASRRIRSCSCQSKIGNPTLPLPANGHELYFRRAHQIHESWLRHRPTLMSPLCRL